MFSITLKPKNKETNHYRQCFMFIPNVSFGPHSFYIIEMGERSGPLFVLREKMEREKCPSMDMVVKS